MLSASFWHYAVEIKLSQSLGGCIEVCFLYCEGHQQKSPTENHLVRKSNQIILLRELSSN